MKANDVVKTDVIDISLYELFCDICDRLRFEAKYHEETSEARLYKGDEWLASKEAFIAGMDRDLLKRIIERMNDMEKAAYEAGYEIV